MKGAPSRGCYRKQWVIYMKKRRVIETSSENNVLTDSSPFELAWETKKKKNHCSLDVTKTGNVSSASNLTLCLLQHISQTERRHFQLSNREALTQRHTYTVKWVSCLRAANSSKIEVFGCRAARPTIPEIKFLANCFCRWLGWGGVYSEKKI